MSHFSNILEVVEQLQAKRNYRKASKYLERARLLGQDDHRFNCLLAKNYQETGNYELSEHHFNLAKQTDPNDLEVLIGLVSLNYETGNPIASALLEELQDKHPKEPSVYYLKSMHYKLNPKDVDICLSLLSKNDNDLLHYALGTTFDKTGQYDRAYYHFVKANDVNSDYSSRLSDIEANLTIHTYTNEFLSKFTGHSSSRPIFVVGLPRSGTTLVEKILSSHSIIGSGGELSYMYDIFRSLSATPFSTLGGFNNIDIIRCAESYLRLTDGIGGVHFVDKLPDNVNMVGFIKILFPNSRIIFCRRDRRDVSLSCWQTNFSVIEWANNFDDISNKFHNFNRVVKHWEAIGIDWFDLSYEDLVSDFDSKVQALLNFVGVGYESSCLDFHRIKGYVRTASVSQVRKPLYASSVGRWKNYFPFLSHEFSIV
jgi:tetratricopeptide (TPR) repeat protein